MIITVVNNTEGVGKSIIAVNIATLRTLVGRTVLLMDLDPKKSSCDWSAARTRANIHPQVPAHSIKGKHLKTEFERLRSGYNDVLIDVDSCDAAGQRIALEIADMVIVPIVMGDNSIGELKQMIGHATNARRTNPKLWVLVVIARAQGMLPISALDKIRDYIAEIPSTALAGTVIRERMSLQHAFKEGLSIFEYKPGDSRAVAEMHDLYRAQKMRRASVPSLSRLLRYAEESAMTP